MAEGQEEVFELFLNNLFYVYAHIDIAGVLSTSFPNRDTFFETNIADINYSFLKFLDANPSIAESNKTTLQSKFENKQYQSVYDIFHDIKLACIIKILEFEDNPTLYSAIDQFYKVSVEILLREAVKLGVSLKNKKSNAEITNESNKVDETDSTNNETNVGNDDQIQKQISQLKPIETTEGLDSVLEKDFDIITSVFYNKTGKSLSIFSAGSIPFFSSINNFQSELDDREPVIDASLGITINNVIPNISMRNTDTLAKFIPTDIKYPNVKQILENYMHPNWLRLISSQWLKHGSGITSLNFSFAPSYDETQSIISNDWKGITWCQQVGFKKLVDLKQKSNREQKAFGISDADTIAEKKDLNEGDKEVVDDEKKDTTTTETKDETKVENTVKNKDENKVEDKVENKDENKDEKKVTEVGNTDVEMQDTVEEPKLVKFSDDEKIDLDNLVSFDEDNLVSDDEAEIISNNNVQAKISEYLTELNSIRHTRYEKQKRVITDKTKLTNGGKVLKPGKDEIKLYNKIKRLLTGLIEKKNIKVTDLNLPLDKRIPVLQHISQGTLPASMAINNSNNNRPSRYKRRK